ncbi:hypothetical protein ACSMX9_19345 [Streptomyces sp. LE64]|uniref:hypothetical protein n=1 Tax=Streptomyces sp. LE64 TaxID=3448653 RepID=UPI004041356C
MIQDRVRGALGKLAATGRIVRLGDAYDVPDRELACARTPTASLAREVAQVPAVERRFVIRRMVEESPGVDRDGLLREVARFFGWARLGSAIRDALTGDVDELLAEGAVRGTGGGLAPADGA